MKKIIFINALTLLALTAVCQNNAKSDGKVQPSVLTIDGMPYSQYKAQQDALKQATNVQQPASNNLNATPASKETIKQRQATPVNNSTQQHIPDRQPIKQEAKANTSTNAKTDVNPASQIVVPTPAIQMIPAGNLKGSTLTPAPVPDKAIESKTTITTTNGGPLVPMPVVNIAVDNGAAKTTTAPANAITQQTVTEAKAAQIQEVPNSPASTTPKLPVMTPSTMEKSGKKN